MFQPHFGTNDCPRGDDYVPKETVLPQNRLVIHNNRWSRRFQCFCNWFGTNWWGYGTVISPEMRGRYNTFLPPDEFHADLRLLACAFFGDDAQRLMPAAIATGSEPFLSLPDFWATLEEPFHNRVQFNQEMLLPLFCNIAEPSRMGTDTGRYPNQLQRLREWLADRAAPRILDLGCGIGLGTWELAAAAADSAQNPTVIGITMEGLAVKMAAERHAPHLPAADRVFRLFPQSLPVAFRQGRAETYNDGSIYDVIVCNGLAGGRFLNSDDCLRQFLENCRKLLAPNGMLLMGNHFHDGMRPGVERLCRSAQLLGWHLSGNWSDLWLSME